MALCVKVIIDDIIQKIDKPYDYYVPESVAQFVYPRTRVIVPFSRANIKKKAFVLEVFNSDDIDNLKPIISLIDEKPLISELSLDILKLLNRCYFVTLYKALKSIVPRGLDYSVDEKYSLEPNSGFDLLEQFLRDSRGVIRRSELSAPIKRQFDQALQEGKLSRTVDAKEKLGSPTEKILSVNCEIDKLEEFIEKLPRNSQKQKDLLSVFIDYPQLSYKDALYYSGCSDSTVRTLCKKGIITISENTLVRNPYKEIERKVYLSEINLSTEQQSVFDSIKGAFDEYHTHLVHGVTGSGKTLVYISLIDKLYLSGKSVIFMVPEISLTPQMLSRFYSRYGDSVCVIHSGLAPGERADEWRKIKSLDKSIVVGTRSAVFSPVNNLGAIIIDEEHEPSYKSESSPKYHARDIAKFICKKVSVPLILGSATPSIESCYYAKKGIYNYHRLEKRFNQNPLPTVEIINMTDSFNSGEQSFLSLELKDAIAKNLETGEQTILFLNRRGANTLVGCRSCGYVEKCPNCGIALTYHSANNRCMCHYCGHSIKMYKECPNCSSGHIMKLGIGTQLVYSELERFFPDAKILRMDFDTVVSYVEYGTKLNAFKNKEYDIMLGTQMVAKGLDFPDVTLVGVLNADLSLHIDDFRANERTFSLLTQVCGRSGRALKPGRAIIQTYSPEHETINFAKKQDYDGYFDFEIAFRKAMNYPPFCDLIRFTVSSPNENTAYETVMSLYNHIDRLSNTEYSDIPIRMLYPTEHRIFKFADKFRYNLVIKARLSAKIYSMLSEIQEEFFDSKSDISININPINNS